MPVRPLVLGLLVMALACDSPLSTDEARALAAARARWAARGFDDYRFEHYVECFCPREITQWLRVDVVGGQVTQVVTVDSTGTIPFPYWSSVSTVEQLFESIRSADESDYLEDVIVEFDPQLGFPVHVSFVSNGRATDVGSVFRLRNVTTLPASPP